MAFKNKSAKFFSAFSISRVLYSKISCIHHNLRLQLKDLQRFRHRNLEPEFVGVTSNKTSAFSTDVLMCAHISPVLSSRWSTWERTMCGPNHQCLRNIRRYLARKENCLPLWILKIHMPKRAKEICKYICLKWLAWHPPHRQSSNQNGFIKCVQTL